MGIFDFFKKKKLNEEIDPLSKIDHKDDKIDQPENPKAKNAADFDVDMAKSAEFFVSRTSERFPGLDFSVKSLKVLDNVLEEASDFYGEMNEDQKQNIISSVGSYVFEVGKRNFGGKYFWYDKLKQPILVTGQPKFEVSILAFDKVKGRLENGKEDNIPFYFAGYVERVQNKESGMIV